MRSISTAILANAHTPKDDQGGLTVKRMAGAGIYIIAPTSL